MERRKEIVRVYTRAHKCGLKVNEYTKRMEEILTTYGGYSLDGEKQWWIDNFKQYQEAIEILKKEGAEEDYSD